MHIQLLNTCGVAACLAVVVMPLAHNMPVSHTHTHTRTLTHTHPHSYTSDNLHLCWALVRLSGMCTVTDSALCAVLCKPLLQVPFPRMHFLLSSLAPLAAPRDVAALTAPRSIDQVCV